MNRIRIPLILLVFAFFLLLCCGADGWLRMYYPHVDSSWFFMAGKAWMNGLQPYEDFTDSKGPLLWLIYGIGYLLSPKTFHGVFWIEVLFYWGTFCFLFKTVSILLKSIPLCLVAVLLQSLFYFIPGVHYEVRAEDFCQLFFAMMAYVLVATFIKEKFYIFNGVIAGIAIGAALMIKFNLAAVIFIPVFFILFSILKKFSFYDSIVFIILMAIGFSLVVIPFCVYFIVNGSFESFINEYFLNTLKTIGDVRGAPGELPDRTVNGFWFLLVSKSWLGIVFKMMIVFVAFLPLRIYKSNLLRISIWIWFVFSALIATSVVHEYYLNFLAIFCFFGLISMLSYIKIFSLSGALLSGATTIAIIVIGNNDFKGRGEFADTVGATNLQKDYMDIAYLISHVSNSKKAPATISYVGLMDRGEHISAQALPGTKYWAHQNGSTSEMHLHNLEDIFINKPDFVFVDKSWEEYRERLEKFGYRHIKDYSFNGSADSLYIIKALYIYRPQ